MKRRAFIQHLQQHGCVLVREGGNHSWWANPAKNKRSSVPRHAEINDLLARKICKDLDIPKPTKTWSTLIKSASHINRCALSSRR